MCDPQLSYCLVQIDEDPPRVFAPKLNFDELREELLSDDERVRSNAAQRLLSWVKNDARIHPRALPVFQAAAAAASDGLTAISAAAGVEYIAGKVAAEPIWQALLRHPDEQIVVCAAFDITDPSFAPTMLQLLYNRPEPRVRCAAIRALGRMKAPGTFEVLVAQLARNETQITAIEALEDFGELRAIPYLEPFLSDDTEVGVRDERGAVLQMGNIAYHAVSHLRARGR
jgi:HEAT repeat protein